MELLKCCMQEYLFVSKFVPEHFNNNFISFIHCFIHSFIHSFIVYLVKQVNLIKAAGADVDLLTYFIKISGLQVENSF